MVSPRIASLVFGIGLLEAIPESEILVNANPDDEGGGDISGKPNYVWDIETGKKEFGRFGWKANTTTVLQHAADAYIPDIGVTNPLLPEESCYCQTQYEGIEEAGCY